MPVKGDWVTMDGVSIPDPEQKFGLLQSSNVRVSVNFMMDNYLLYMTLYCLVKHVVDFFNQKTIISMIPYL